MNAQCAELFKEEKKYIKKEKCLTCRIIFSHYHDVQVLRVESLISKMRTSGLDILLLLKSSDEYLPDELSSASLEVF